MSNFCYSYIRFDCHCFFFQALSLDVKGNRGIDYEHVLGVSELSLTLTFSATDTARDMTIDNKGVYAKKRTQFMELLHLQHYYEILEYTDFIVVCIDKTYDVYAAAELSAKRQIFLDKAIIPLKQVSKATISSTATTNIHGESGKIAVLPSTTLDTECLVVTPVLPLGLIRHAIILSDHNKTRSEVNNLLSYCCKLTIENMLFLEARRTPFNLEEFKKRIRMKVMKKS